MNLTPLYIEADPGPPEEPEFALAGAPIPTATLVVPDNLTPAPPSPAPTSLTTPADALQARVVAAVADTLHAIDLPAHLALLARTDARTFRMWVEMCLPKAQQRGAGNNQALILNMQGTLPKSALDALPPGFNTHHN